MGLFAVIGPSRKDHFGLPRFFSRSRSNASIRCQNCRTSRSRAGKSTCVSTLAKAISEPRDVIGKPLFYQRPQKCGRCRPWHASSSSDARRALTIATTDGRQMTERIRVAVLLSGAGTTLQNLLHRIGDGRLRAEVVLVVSNRSDAFGLQHANNAGIATAVVTRKDYDNAEEFSEHIFSLCRQARADLVCMAGFLQLIRIPADFLGRVLNIHPALIPAF